VYTETDRSKLATGDVHVVAVVCVAAATFVSLNTRDVKRAVFYVKTCSCSNSTSHGRPTSSTWADEKHFEALQVFWKQWIFHDGIHGRIHSAINDLQHNVNDIHVLKQQSIRNNKTR